MWVTLPVCFVALATVCSTLPPGLEANTGYQFNRTLDTSEINTGSALKGPLGNTLNEIVQRLQQHDQEQRLNAIQQLQQRELLQDQLRKQTDEVHLVVSQLQSFERKVDEEMKGLNQSIHRSGAKESRTEPANTGEIIGCYNDARERDLPNDHMISPNMTHHLCSRHCISKGYRYAAVQNALECFCGNSYGRYGASNACNKTCPGDQHSWYKCGGVLANTVIRISSEYGSDDVLIQQHYGGTNFFSKTWVEFKSEFGHIRGNYWIGNERLHQLTKDGRYRLRIDMLAKSNNLWYWAEYVNFIVYDEASGYTLNIGGYTGSAGDAMLDVNGRMFSTKDKDQDMNPSVNCVVHGTYGNNGGFWYNSCGLAYLNSPHDGECGFAWNKLPIGSGWADKKLLAVRMTLTPK